MLLTVAALWLASACSPDKGFGEAREVRLDDYGADWPLTVETALLNCTPEGGLLVQIEGHAFELDVRTVEDAHPGFRRVWAKAPDARGDERMNLAPLVEDARELCG